MARKAADPLPVFKVGGIVRLNHTDLWGHINFGRWIVTHQALPATDPLAAQPSATGVLQYAWLSQTLGYEVHRLFGNEGLALARGEDFASSVVGGKESLKAVENATWVDDLWAQVRETARDVGVDL